ncbi:MAG: hypothetical protein KBT01_07590, partial [Clostridiales bacterium]|nr:hypothetical protein [Candidatus Blautia equi]
MNLPILTQPRSIAALEKWYADQKLPNYQFTRYFIGINYKKARAFGICKDESTGNFIVYSNDSAGKRTLVYDGPSESEAAGIFFEKLNGEVTRHKESLDKDLQKKKKEENPGIMKQAYGGFGGFILKTIKLVFIYLAGAIAVITIMILGARFFSSSPADGYYKYEDTLYYFEYAP